MRKYTAFQKPYLILLVILYPHPYIFRIFYIFTNFDQYVLSKLDSGKRQKNLNSDEFQNAKKNCLKDFSDIIQENSFFVTSLSNMGYEPQDDYIIEICNFLLADHSKN